MLWQLHIDPIEQLNLSEAYIPFYNENIFLQAETV